MRKLARFPMFLQEAIIFLLANVLGLAAAYLILKKEIISPVASMSSLAAFGITFFIATVILLIVLKFYKGKSLFKLFFMLLIFIGSEFVLSAFLPKTFSIIIALALVALWLTVPKIIVHNIVILITIAGISTSIGVVFALPLILILLAALSVYDVLAVFLTKHMVTMFKDMMSRGVVLSIVMPQHLENLFANVSQIKFGEGFMLLGTGDIAFPLIFAVSALRISLQGAVGAVLGALAGLFIVYLLLVTQTQRRALPALPPIAICSVLGFLLASFI